MKIRLFPFTRDLRSEDQKQRYQQLEQKRADAYLAMYLARQRACILRGQVRCPLLVRQAD